MSTSWRISFDERLAIAGLAHRSALATLRSPIPLTVTPAGRDPERVHPDEPLNTPLRYVKSIGSARADLLQKLGLRTVDDLLHYLPRKFLDLTDVRAVPQLEADVLQSVRGVVCDVEGRDISGGRTMSAVLLDCDGHFLRGVWFNQPWMLKKFRPDQHVLFSGKPKRRGGRWEISNPRVQWLDAETVDATAGVQPVYRLTEGLKADQLRRVIGTLVDEFLKFVADPLPPELRRECDLIDHRTAIQQLHQPRTIDEFKTAQRRLIYEDLLEFQIGLALRRRLWKHDQAAPSLPTSARIDARIRRLFPFRFTAAQDEAIREITEDLARGEAMHRLLQADVGAGKTAVAMYAMLVAIAAGYQTVLMAPTEVLAVQHWETINTALQQSRVTRTLLTGKLTAADRRQALSDIQTGAVQLIVGTQAVIQEGVEFNNLGLAAIDEQHKFGVMQRARFSSGGLRPHVLVMTATPIPRSLCLTQFGDLDISVMSELPPGRQKIVTSKVPPAKRKKAWNFIRKQLDAGRQVFVVCPRVEATDEAGDEPDTGSAEAVHADLSSGELANYTVGIVHGRMHRDDKAAAMESFRDNETQVLVSTTVIEVGVDVPNATIMLVMQAERFGLSQLHQLRGRIGRGRFQGYCFLFSDSQTPEATARLTAMEDTTDGFKIAEVDFELRGPGDVLGTRQSGRLPLRVADLIRDQPILKEARLTAFGLVQSGRLDEAEFASLKRKVLERFAKVLELPKSG